MWRERKKNKRTNPTFASRCETKEQLNQHNRACEHWQRVSAFCRATHCAAAQANKPTDNDDDNNNNKADAYDELKK